jgi:hypothetical protein
MGTALAVAGLVVSAVGAGVSYVQANAAADQQSQIALLNAQSQRQALDQQGRAASMQALINQTLADKDRAAANANAVALEQQAQTGTRITTENIRRNREEMARFAALQRAQAANSGFVDTTGSPLALLASTAEEEQKMADAARYEDEMSRRSLFREAAFQRNTGTLAGIEGLGAKIGGAAARAQAALGQSQSRLDLFAARAGASAMRTGATANLLSSAGGFGQDVYSLYRQTPRTAKKAQATY